jgi:hypothetical protein
VSVFYCLSSSYISDVKFTLQKLGDIVDVIEMAQTALEKEGKPLHYKEIARRIMAIC